MLLPMAHLHAHAAVGPGPDPVFHALVPDGSEIMQGVLVGTGGLTEARTSNVWIPDYLGVLREFGANELAWEGGRVTGAVGSRVVYANDGASPLPEVPKIVYEPASTNQCLYSIPTNTWSRFNSAALTANVSTSPDGDNKASRLSASSGNPYCYPPGNTMTFVSGETYCFSCFAKYENVRYLFIGGNIGYFPNTERAAYFDIQNGVVATFDTNVDAGVIPFGDGWYRFYAAMTADANGTAYPSVIAPASRDGDGSGDRFTDPPGSGSFVWGYQAEVGPVPTAHIPTVGANASRDAGALLFDAANHSDTEGTYYLETTGSTMCALISQFLDRDSGNVRLLDGVNVQQLPAPPSIYGMYKVGFVYGSGTMRLNVNGSWHASGSYDGSLPDGVLDIFRTAICPQRMRNLRRYAQKDEAIINTLMAA